MPRRSSTIDGVKIKEIRSRYQSFGLMLSNRAKKLRETHIRFEGKRKYEKTEEGSESSEKERKFSRVVTEISLHS